MLSFICHRKSVDDIYVDALVGEAVNLLKYIDFDKPTVLYIHGYSENLDQDSVHAVVGGEGSKIPSQSLRYNYCYFVFYVYQLI